MPSSPELQNHYIPEDYFRVHTGQDIFGNNHPLEIDLGCGDGKFLLEMAEKHPEKNFLGVELLLGRVRKVCKKAEKRGLTNVRVLRLDSKYVAEWFFKAESVARIHLLCPDPWPKAKHHKRRLVQQDFLAAVRKVLIPEGFFCFKTDHDEYFEWVLEELKNFAKLNIIPWQNDDFFYPKADFQLQWEAQGKTINKILLQK